MKTNVSHTVEKRMNLDRDGASSKSQGGKSQKCPKIDPPKAGKLYFIAFLHYNFEKSGGPPGSADPSDPPVAPSLVLDNHAAQPWKS